jgi:hypothetical protein
MSNMDGWSLLLLAVAAWLAATGLAQLMKSRHDGLVGRIRRQWQEEQARRAAEAARRRQEEREKRLREQLNKPAGDSSGKAA